MTHVNMALGFRHGLPLVRTIALQPVVGNTDPTGEHADARPANRDWLAPFDGLRHDAVFEVINGVMVAHLKKSFGKMPRARWM
jgi:hypothetical protein